MIKAENKNYVIKALGQEKTTSGGIIMHRTDETELAEVVSAGPQVENALAIGTKVVINWGNVLQVKIGGEAFFLIHADNVLGSIV